MFAVSFGLVALGCSLAAPYPPPGRYFVEAVCESSTEYAFGERSAEFVIDRMSGNFVNLIGTKFSVKYKDSAVPRFGPNNWSMLIIPHFAPRDLAYWWVEVVDGQVKPITDRAVLHKTLGQDRDNIVRPIRARSARSGDEMLVRESSFSQAYGEAMMKIALNRCLRREQEKVLADLIKSDVPAVAALAKWLLDTHYPTVTAR